MEEATLDHGLDRLPFFFLFLLFFAYPASATTFGPITVVGQVRYASYVVHARVNGAAWVAEERESRRPHTYWKVRVLDQANGDKLGPELTIRQPGGELGGMGYHVAGAAQFRDGEEIFVSLEDTNEAHVKQVVGLASGKYTVERDEGGQAVIRSGLGAVIRDAGGTPLSPEKFTALVRRIAAEKDTEEDKNVFVNKAVAHERTPPPPTSPTGTASALAPSPLQPSSPPAPENGPKPVEESPPPAEEPKSSSWWIYAALAVLGLAAGTVYLRNR
jgi:hypothetical protein